MSARDRIHAMLPICDSPAEAAARETEMNARLDDYRTEVLAEVTAWLIKKAREFHVRSRKQERAQGDTCASLASQIARGAVRPNNVDMLPTAGFFEVDHAYQWRGDEFRVLAVDPHPIRGDLTAVGWLIETDGTCLIIRMTGPEWESGKWVEVTP
ncbi:hypothetical protein [Streptomyces sp. NPDC050121]|uniref:hypothetical protein n=1 Tax=Streptomyces sp. NPDC050121 TaxID=3365601 RepID=UPI0037B52860